MNMEEILEQTHNYDALIKELKLGMKDIPIQVEDAAIVNV